MSKFTKDAKLSELLNNPRTQKVLVKYNLPCLSCPFAESEMENLKLGDVCKMYSINLKALLTELSRSETKR